ncbi:MAG: FAD-dependent oxidoreductase [Vampirovibrionales bacterium]|nr:FAD-dependent oxidoreductase [Vampirovibrionales bacterium]
MIQAENPPLWDVAIVGAGMAGLMAATSLASKGYRVIVLDKGRQVGGRMATRYCLEPSLQWRFDHGAQFMRFRTAQGQQMASQWVKDGLIFNWLPQLMQSSASTHAIEPCGNAIAFHPDVTSRFASPLGMTCIPKALSQALQHDGSSCLLTSHLIRAVEPQLHAKTSFWRLWPEDNECPDRVIEPIDARVLLLTPPVPQALALLKNPSQMDPDVYGALQAITYAPCLALLLGFLPEASITLAQGFHGAIQWLQHPILGWLADNQHKGISPLPALTLQASAAFSEAFFDADEATIVQKLLSALNNTLQEHLPPAEVTYLKRWRYSIPVATYPAPYAYSAHPAPVYFAGDAFDSPEGGAKRVEGALLSGQAAADAIHLALCMQNLSADGLKLD